MGINNLVEVILDGCKNGKIDKTIGVKLLTKVKKISSEENRNIAVVGMSAQLPSANNLDEFWENIMNGKDCIKDYPEQRKKDIRIFVDTYTNIRYEDAQYIKGGYLEEIDKFDHEFFKMSAREADLMDPGQRIFLETAWSSIEDAGYGNNKLSGTKTGVYVGYCGWPAYGQVVQKNEQGDSNIGLSGNVPSILASRISYLLDLKGPSVMIDTACSSSLVAIHMACGGLYNRECDTALAGGIALRLYPVKGGIDVGIESEDAKVRAFDDAANGTVWGEGCGVLLLKRLGDAIRDKDNIYAVIRATEINQDGKSIGITAPNRIAQEEMIIQALKNANVNPEDIAYIETHGTGTKLGDPIEIEAISNAYKRFTQKKQFCAVGSIKGNIGHLDSASGVAGMIKMILALKAKKIPPTIHFTKPNRNIDFVNSPVYFNDSLLDWEKNKNNTRLCAISSFGFSGTNCHIILEEAPEIDRKATEPENNVFVSSAKKLDGLKQLIHSYYEFVKTNTFELSDLCYTAATGRGHYEYRIAIKVENKADLVMALEHLDKQFEEAVQMENIFYGSHHIISGHVEKKETGYVTNQELVELSKEVKNLITESTRENNIDKIISLYVKGATINWESYFSKEHNKVHFPTYPFSRTRCWISDYREHKMISEDTSLQIVEMLCDIEENENCVIMNGLSDIGIKTAKIIAEKKKANLLLVDSLKDGTWKNELFEWNTIINENKNTVLEYDLLASEKKLRALEYKTEMEYYEKIRGEKFRTEIIEDVNVLCAHYIYLYFQNMGVDFSEAISVSELDVKLNIIPAFKKMFQFLIRVLEQNHFIEKNDEMITFLVKQVNEEDIKAKKQEILKDREDLEVVIKLLEKCVNSYSEALSGKVLSIGMLYKDGKSDMVESIYDVTKIYSNREAQIDFVTKLVQQMILERKDEPVRILEVGAGNGILTGKILEKLDITNIEYYFTDVSVFFLNKAKKKYGSSHGSHMNYKILDVSKDPIAQGFRENSFDLILGLDVIHATENIHTSLTNMYTLLRGNGVLFLIELVKEFAWIDMIWGMTEGWWQFSDYDVRKYSPLLNIDKWKNAFIQSGYQYVTGFGDSIGNELYSNSGVIIGQTKKIEEEKSKKDIWLPREEVQQINELGGKVFAVGFTEDEKFVSEWAEKYFEDYRIIDFSKGRSNKNRVGTFQLSGKSDADYTDTERKVANIWHNIMGSKCINVYDNFYEVGGDSIIAMSVCKEIESQFMVKVEVSELFSLLTVHTIAELIDKRVREKHFVEKEMSIQMVHDEENNYEPFLMTQVQKAYFVGRDSSFELGGISTMTFVEIETELDIEGLNRAFNKLIGRHEMLRAIILEGGKIQFMKDTPQYKIETINILAFSRNEQQSVLQVEKKRMSQTIFPVGSWPMFECKAFKIEECKHVILMSLDALIFDGASTKILCNELYMHYKQEDLQMKPFEVNFRDYVCAYEKLRQSKQYENDKQYWLQQLEEFPMAPKLPLIVDTEKVEDVEFQRLKVHIDEKIWNGIKKECRSNNVTASSLLATIYAYVLAFGCNQEKMAINLTLFNRYPFHQDVSSMIGDFTSLILLGIEIDKQKSFWENVKCVQKLMMEAIEHRSYDGLEFIREIVRYHNMDMSKAIMPVVFTCMISDDKHPEEENGLTQLGKISIGSSQTPQVYLDNQASQVDGKLCVSWDYVEQLFEKEEIEYLFNLYVNMIKQIGTVGQVEKLHISDTMLNSWRKYNDTAKAFDFIALHEMFCHQAQYNGSNVAVICENEQITYEELDKQSNQVANYLIDRSVNPHDYVCVIADRNIKTISNILGVLKVGAAYVPIEPDTPQKRKDIIANSSKSKLTIDAELDCSGYSVDIEHIKVAADDVAYVIYTSGSTGTPKGVVITHSQACNTILDINQRNQVNHTDKIIGLSSYYFDLSVYDIFGSFQSGATLVIVPDQRDGSVIIDILMKHDITIWNSVPAIMELLIESSKEKKISDSMRCVMLSGDWIPVTLPAKIKDSFANAKIISMGGATEAAIWSIYYDIDEVKRDWKSIPYGMPLSNQQMYILNYDLELCNYDICGDIYIGGAGVANGYLNDQKRTEESFIHHPVYGKIYRTNDRGTFRREGYIEFQGRIDNQAKIRGFRVELDEIKNCILKYDSITLAEVIVKTFANNTKQICAFYTASKEIQESQLKEYIGNQLPYYMVPVYYKQLSTFPLTSNGKLNKKALLEYEFNKQKQNITNASNEVEKTISDIWSDILQCKVENMNTSFFELSGDSLKIQRLKNRMEDIFKCNISIKKLFANPTISAMASLVTGTSETEKNKKVHTAREGKRYFWQKSVHWSVEDNKIVIKDKVYEDIALDDFVKIYSMSQLGFYLEDVEKVTKGQKNICHIVKELIQDGVLVCSIPTLDEVSFVSERFFEDKYDETILYNATELQNYKLTQLNRDLEANYDCKLFLQTEKEFPAFLTNRRTWRHYNQLERITFDQFSYFLSALKQIRHEELIRYYYASAGGLYPIDIYIYVKARRIEGIEEGIYYYDPRENALKRVYSSTVDLVKMNYIGNKDMMESAAFFVWFIYNAESNMPKYGNKGYVYGLIDTGIMVSTITHMAEQVDIGLCPIGDLDFETVRKYMCLKDNQIFFHGLCGGIKAEENEVDRKKFSQFLIEKQPVMSYYPVSSAQNRIFMLSKFEKDSLNYNTSAAHWIDGPVDVDRFEAAFAELVQRHEILRTSFDIIDGKTVQIIYDHVEFHVDFEEVDLSEIDARIEEFIRPFDLGCAPLMRVCLLKVSEEKWVLLFDLHHIITDWTSTGVLLEEFIILYHSGTLEPLKIQYKDFAVWQNRMLEESDYIKKQEDYWVQMYQENIPVLELPYDYPRAALQSYDGDTLNIQLKEAVLEKLKSYCMEKRVTLYMVLYAATSILLKKISNQNEIVLGVPIAGREHAQLEKTIGMFLNTLPVKSYPESQKELSVFISEVRESLLKAYENQDYQFETLVSKVYKNRDNSRNPLFDVMLVLQDNWNEKIDLGELSLKSYNMKSKIARMDLTITAIQKQGKLNLEFEYCTKLFKEETISSIAEGFYCVIEQILEDRNQTIGDFTLLSEAQRKHIENWNQTDCTVVGEKTISKEFIEQFKKYSSDVAIVQNDQTVTYEELDKITNEFAHFLRSKGAGPEKPIVIIGNRSLEEIIGIVSIVKAGSAYVPVSAQTPEARIQYIIEDCSAQIVLLLNDMEIDLKDEVHVIRLDKKFLSSIKDRNELLIESINRPEDLAYIIYTSGTTGNPKGVMIEHKSVMNLSSWFGAKYNLRENRNVLHITDISFDVSVEETVVSLLNGATIYIPDKMLILDKLGFKKYVDENNIQVTQFVPSLLRELIVDNEKMDTIKVLISGGERLDNEIKDDLLKKGYPLYNHYGPTETTVDALACKCKLTSDDIGYNVANLRNYVVDADGKLQNVGLPGELCIAGVGLARGYLNNPEFTEEKFRLVEVLDGKMERLYFTKDKVKQNQDGSIQYIGRIDQQVKIRGYRIELEEIESFIRRCDDVKDACVTVQKDNAGQDVLVAYLVSNTELNYQAIKTYLLSLLPNYMVPSYFTKIDEIPKTIAEKVDKKNLKLPLNEMENNKEKSEPQNDVQRFLLDLWKDLLGREQIDIYDNFFDIGGNSILVMKMHSAIEKEYPWKIQIADIFAYSSIDRISEFMLQEQSNVKVMIRGTLIKEEFMSLEQEHKEGKHISFEISNELVEKIKNIIVKDSMTEEKFFVSVYCCMLLNICKEKQVSMYCAESENRVNLVEVNMEQVDNLETLFHIVKHQIMDGQSYDINSLQKDYEAANDDIFSFFSFNKQMKNTKNIQWDTELNVGEHNGVIELKWSFSEKIIGKEELYINAYLNIVEAICDAN